MASLSVQRVETVGAHVDAGVCPVFCVKLFFFFFFFFFVVVVVFSRGDMKAS